jgi:hypothetical protein
LITSDDATSVTSSKTEPKWIGKKIGNFTRNVQGEIDETSRSPGVKFLHLSLESMQIDQVLLAFLKKNVTNCVGSQS